MSDGSAAMISSGPVVDASCPLPSPSSSLSSLSSLLSPSASANPPSDPSSAAMSDGSAFVVPSGSVVNTSSPSISSSPSSSSFPSAPSDPSSSLSPSVPYDPPSNPDERLVQARQECRQRARQHHVARIAATAASAEMLRPGHSDHQTLLVLTASEPGLSPWLTASSSPTSIVLSKRDFRDAVAIRYGFTLFGLAERCACGEALTIHHGFVCPAGGYPSARHIELMDPLAAALGEVVSDVELEPRSLPLTDESCPSGFVTGMRRHKSTFGLVASGRASKKLSLMSG